MLELGGIGVLICQQLARCCQFAEITSRYSDRDRRFLSEMALEAATPQQKPSIATCVRRISYLTFPPNVMTLHRRLFDLYGEGASVDVKEERQRLRQEANQLYVENRSLAAKAISLMPNIDILVWADPFSLDSNFFQQISRSKVQHLKLGKTFIDEPWSLEPPLTPTTWLLRSLHLDVTLSSSYSIPAGSDSNQLMSNFYSSLFRLCSPALESLRWADSDDSPGPMGPLSLGSNLLSFPRLRDLQLEHVDLDNAGLSTLLSSPLRSLKISGPVWDRLDARRLAHGPLRDLESFIVPVYHLSLLRVEMLRNSWPNIHMSRGSVFTNTKRPVTMRRTWIATSYPCSRTTASATYAPCLWHWERVAMTPRCSRTMLASPGQHSGQSDGSCPSNSWLSPLA